MKDTIKNPKDPDGFADGSRGGAEICNAHLVAGLHVPKGCVKSFNACMDGEMKRVMAPGFEGLTQGSVTNCEEKVLGSVF